MEFIEIIEKDKEDPLNRMVILSESPQVYTIDNMITDEECEHMINISKDKMTNSLVSDDMKGTISAGRTSKNAWIPHNFDDTTFRIGEKIAKIVNIPLENAEAFQVIYYGENCEYRNHFDSWDHNGSTKTIRCMKYGGARLKTALVYLNEVEEGGSTKLNKVNIDVNAKKGKMLVFENTYTGTNIKHPLSEHAGMPVIKGEKYAFNLWFKECNSKKLYSEFNPDYYKNIDTTSPVNSITVTNELNQNPTYSNNVSTDNVSTDNADTTKTNVTLDTDHDSITKYKYNNILNISSHFTKEYTEKNIYSSKLFIFSSECDKIISQCQFNTTATQKYANCWIKKDSCPELIQKIEMYTGIKSTFFENLNIFKYLPKQSHGPFTDSYNLASENGMKYTKVLGQRIFTLSIPLNNTIDYHFPKLNTTLQYSPGTLLLYDNITSRSIRDTDPNMEHTIKNINDHDGYVLNVYIREKDTLGSTLMIIPSNEKHLSLPQPIPTVINESNISTIEQIPSKDDPSKQNISNTQSVPEEYMKTYEEVLNMFKNKTITSSSWRGYKSFTYIFKGQLEYFNKSVLEYIKTRTVTGNTSSNITAHTDPTYDLASDKFIDMKLLNDTSSHNTHNTYNALNMDHFNKKHIFDEYTPIILNDTIKPDTLTILQEYYTTTINSGVFLLGDKQSTRFKAHNEPMSRLLHYEMLPLIEDIVGKKLQPTYTYLSCYVDGSDLPAHTDRADCEYTVSFIINKPENKRWPIYFHTKKQPTKYQGRVNFTPSKDECVECDCNPGGFMMFNGTDHIHFREKFDGEFYHIVLLHYRCV